MVVLCILTTVEVSAVCLLMDSWHIHYPGMLCLLECLDAESGLSYCFLCVPRSSLKYALVYRIEQHFVSFRSTTADPSVLSKTIVSYEQENYLLVRVSPNQFELQFNVNFDSLNLK